MDTAAIERIIAEHEATGRYLMVEGVKTFALDRGSGPLVFCIHGVPTSSFLYRKVAKALEDLGLRVIAIDLPGLGLSDRPEDFDYRFFNYARFCNLFLDAVQTTGCHLLVHDIGCPVGLAMAAANSSRIQSITVLNAMLDMQHFQKPLPMRPFEKPLLGEAELAAMTHTTWPLMMQYAGVEDLENIPREEMAAYINLLKRDDGGKAFLKIMRQFEQSKAFTDICYRAIQNNSYPVQLIWGMDDPFLTFEEHGKTFVEARPDARVYKVTAKHFVPEEQYLFIAEKIKELAV